jgi:hypothetical protein
MKNTHTFATSRIISAVIIATIFLMPLKASMAGGATFMAVSSPSPNVQGNTFNAVNGLSSSDIWAVGFQNDNQLNGSRTITEHWNGNIWAVIASPNPGSPPSCDGQNSGNMLNAVAEVTANNVWSVGFQFSCSSLLKPMILHSNGRSWNVVPSPALRTNDNSALNGIVALSRNNIYAVGYQLAANGAVLALVEHWNGSAWSVVNTPNANSTGNNLMAVSADSPSDVWAVGDKVAPNVAVQTLVEHFDGMRWSVVPSPNPVVGSDLDQNVLTGVIALSPTDVTAAGFILDFATQRKLTLIEHWDGQRWKVVPSPNADSSFGAFNTLTGISGFNSSDLYAVGYFGDPNRAGQHATLVEHFDGISWSIVPSPKKGVAQHLNGAFALPGSMDLWTVGAFSINGDDPETGLLIVPRTLVLFSSDA